MMGCKHMAIANGAEAMVDWRVKVAEAAVDCLGMGMRIVHIGMEANPSELRLMRARQQFDGPTHEDDGPMAVTAGLYARAPLEENWVRLCSTDDAVMTIHIAGMLTEFGDRMAAEAVALAVLRRWERLRAVRMMPSAAQEIATALRREDSPDL